MDNPALEALDLTVQCIFTADVAVKIASEGVRPTRFWWAHPLKCASFPCPCRRVSGTTPAEMRPLKCDQAGAAAGLEQF